MSKQDKAIALLQQAFDALETTGDSDIVDFEDEEEEAEYVPVQYACRKIIEAIGILQSNDQVQRCREAASAATRC